MNEAVKAYRHVASSPEFRTVERMRSKARHDEAQALYNAERKRDEHWQGVVAKKDEHWQGVVAEKNKQWQGVVADKVAENAEFRAQLEELRTQLKNN